jgi:hypothetical protein
LENPAGKMSFYFSAVDDCPCHPDDQPSIGILLFDTRSKVITEYALQDVGKPTGVARYVTRLVKSLPDNLKAVLSSPGQIAAGLEARERR